MYAPGRDRNAINPTTLEPPFVLNLLVGGTCRLRCRFCNGWQNEREQMPGRTWARVFGELAEWLPGTRIVLSGGEPLRHPDIETIVRAAADCGLLPGLCTSGDPLNADLCKRVAGWPLAGVVFSLDGFEETHDYLRRRKGLYAQVLSAIRSLKRDNPSLGLATLSVINSVNVAELPGLVQYLDDLPEIDGIAFQAFVPFTGDELEWHDPRESEFWPHPYHSIGFADWLLRYAKTSRKIANSPGQIEMWKGYFRSPESVRRRFPTCYVCDNTVSVKPDGRVVLCDFYGPIGDLNTASLREIWTGGAAAAMRATMRDCGRFCNMMINCSFEDRHLRGSPEDVR